jgi:hypothetical protein
MARPTVMTPEVIAKLEEAFAWGCTDREACLWAGIAEETLYNHQNRNPEFLKRKEALKETPVLIARKSVVTRLGKDSKLSMDYLSRKKKDEFSTRAELTGKDGDQLIPQPILGGNSKAGDGLSANNSDPETSQAK